ncbi:MAG: type II secretion system F family protein [Bradymonadaceae bacterium]
MIYLWLALPAIFLTAVLAVLAGGDWAVQRISEKKNIYEQFVGEHLHRLFMDASVEQFILGHIGVMILSGAFGWFVWPGGWWGLVPFTIIGAWAPKYWLDRRWEKRKERVNEQVEEAMIYMANSFKANPSLPEAIKDVTRSMPPPITEELSIALREYQLGTPLDKALINLQERMPARNLELAVSAIRIGRAVGGNIPSILEDIAGTIRESYRLQQVIDTQTAQGKMQAWFMGAMPAAVVGVFYWMDPQLIRPLFETWFGYGVLAVAIILNIIGVYFILQVIDIRV